MSRKAAVENRSMISTNEPKQNFRVAIIGVGMMGAAIAQRFIDCGYHLSLYTRSPEKLRPLVAQRALARSPDVRCELRLDGDTLVDTGKTFGPAGHPASMRGRVRH